MNLPTSPAKPGQPASIDLDSIESEQATTGQSTDLKAMNIAQLAARIKTLQESVKELESMTSSMKSEIEYISMTILPEKMADQGITSTVVKGVGRVTVKADMFCNVPADNKPALEKWLKEHGYEDLIKPTVNASSLKAMVKELSESQDEDEVNQWIEIQDIVSVRPFVKATLTKN